MHNLLYFCSCGGKTENGMIFTRQHEFLLVPKCIASVVKQLKDGTNEITKEIMKMIKTNGMFDSKMAIFQIFQKPL